VLAVRFSTLPTSTATGWYIAVLAGSASIGGLLAGVLAQTFGYSAILWMAAASFATGLLVNVFGLCPAERKIRAEEAREGAVSTGEVAPALE
jgi:MFS family permease